MPIIIVHQSSGRTADQRRRAVAGITQGICSAYELDPETLTVIFSDMEPDKWWTGRQLRSDRG